MKIAVTYAGGEIFQHFGHTEQFKIYEIEENTDGTAAGRNPPVWRCVRQCR